MTSAKTQALSTDTSHGRVRKRHRHTLRSLLGALILLLLATPGTAQERWLRIDVDARTLTVLEGEEELRTFTNISIGRNGSASLRLRGDNRTPVGRFHVNRMTTDSRFHRFFGLDYPTVEHAEHALAQGQIGPSDYLLIKAAFANRHPPPPNTPLGGHIGIHGLGAGDPSLHESFDWTNGCVALTNEQIDELAQYVELGTVVIIR